MAHNRSYKPEDIAFPNQVITQSNLVALQFTHLLVL